MFSHEIKAASDSGVICGIARAGYFQQPFPEWTAVRIFFASTHIERAAHNGRTTQ
jgi:hypothetical protein